MADRMQALVGQVIGVIAGFAHLVRPADQGGVQAVAHFLLLFVEQLVRRFFPSEPEIAFRWNQSQSYRAPRRKNDRQAGGCNLTVRKITGGNNVWNRPARLATLAASFGKVDFKKTPVRAAQLAKRMQRFHHAGPLRPPTTDAGGERDNGGFTIAERSQTAFEVGTDCRTRLNMAPTEVSRPTDGTHLVFVGRVTTRGVRPINEFSCVKNIYIADVFDDGRGR